MAASERGQGYRTPRPSEASPGPHGGFSQPLRGRRLATLSRIFEARERGYLGIAYPRLATLGWGYVHLCRDAPDLSEADAVCVVRAYLRLALVHFRSTRARVFGESIPQARYARLGLRASLPRCSRPPRPTQGVWIGHTQACSRASKMRESVANLLPGRG